MTNTNVAIEPIYCYVERTNCFFDAIFPRMKLIQLENDATYGDVFDDFILCAQGNAMVYTNEHKSAIFKKGDYVNLIPLSLIDVLVSNRNDLLIDNFNMYTEQKTFYPLLGFEVEDGDLGAEILDKDSNRIINKIRYYYIRKRDSFLENGYI